MLRQCLPFILIRILPQLLLFISSCILTFPMVFSCCLYRYEYSLVSFSCNFSIRRDISTFDFQWFLIPEIIRNLKNPYTLAVILEFHYKFVMSFWYNKLSLQIYSVSFWKPPDTFLSNRQSLSEIHRLAGIN